ncbi:hypothetical protein TRFO_01070 [Tritrichomonas foetus]|uniref:Uncharacterized protein n=1 Tax=Tritrichomonas foetus TaxID=1144522 RepID=A0A1J4KIJ1_9EUKA|nr:hypothetical protein TRFO_01070 [Tritrichomonas foetus]|eukprot:OHT11167.1 hypothetical protein TRFO_01070 [Tritrichomonas foetus]
MALDYKAEMPDRKKTLDDLEQSIIKSQIAADEQAKKQFYENKNCEDILDNLANLSLSFKNNNETDIFQYINGLSNILNRKNCSIYVIPQSNIIEIMNYFELTQNIAIRGRILKFFETIINKDRTSIDCLLKMSFLDCLIKYRNELPEDKNIILPYICIILGLLKNSSNDTTKFIMSIITLDFVNSLYFKIKLESVFSKWLECINVYIKYPIPLEYTSNLLQVLSRYLESVHDNSHIDSKICKIIETTIENNPIDWEVFISCGYPHFLSEFIQSDDYRLIEASSCVIGKCAICDFYNFNFNISDVYNACVQFDSQAMYKSIFLAYALISEKSQTHVDAFFSEVTIKFLEVADEFEFKLKNEISLFVSSMLKFALLNHIHFILETTLLNIVYYALETNYEDNIYICLEGLAKIAPLIVSSQIREYFENRFKEIVPQDLLLNLVLPDDEETNNLFRYILQNYPFILGNFEFQET